MNCNEKSNNNFNYLVEFIREQIREFSMPILRTTLIEDGLGVTGEDAKDLIFAFSNKYEVDISNFNFKKYFYDEPGVFNIQNRKIEPFMVLHLEKAIIAGRLDEEIINS